MKQTLTPPEIQTRVAHLQSGLGDLAGVAHAGVLAKAFDPAALERALNLAFAQALGALTPLLLNIHRYLTTRKAPFGIVELPVPGSTGAAFCDKEFKTFAIQVADAFTYMVVLEPLPPVVKVANPEMQQWAIHLRICTRGTSQSSAVAATPLGDLKFLGDFKYHADRPVPAGQKYFREWDCSDRGFLASTEPTTGGEAWTPADVTRGRGVSLFQEVLEHLKSVAAAVEDQTGTKQGLNTLLQLSYRDAGNFGSVLEEVLQGAISSAQVAEMSSLLNDGYQLIADQVGLPTPSFVPRAGESDWPCDEMDHVWTTIAQFEAADSPTPQVFATSKEPTLLMTVDELMERLRAVRSSKLGWDIAAEWARMQEAGAWSSRQPDSQSVLRPLRHAA